MRRRRCGIAHRRRNDTEDNPRVWRRRRDRRARFAYKRRRRVGALDRVRQQRPRTRRRAAVFICGVDVHDERPRCACDVLAATPSPRTTVRLATTPRSTSALCVIATTSSRRPRPSSPTTTSYALTSRCVYLRRRRRRPNDLAVRVTCCLRHCRRVRPCVWRRRPVLRALCA